MLIKSFIKDHSRNVVVVFTDAEGNAHHVDIIGWAVTQVPGQRWSDIADWGTLLPVIIDPNGKPAVPDSAEDRAAGITWRLLEA